MKVLFAIGTGSFVGGVLRYAISQYVHTKVVTTFPIGTLLVNLAGCFLIGVVFGLTERGNLAPEWRLFLATGVLGGFTTFSAFSNETVGMLRDGQSVPALVYVVLSIFVGLTATVAGAWVTKSI